jgi:hypothetical protein
VSQPASQLKRFLVFGGRDYKDRGAVYLALDAVFAKHGPFVLVHGAARGADSLGASWGLEMKRHGVVVEPHPAIWRPKGPKGPIDRSAGPRRNAEMLASGLDGAVGFPGGVGTADMEQRLTDAGVPVWWPRGGGSA